MKYCKNCGNQLSDSAAFCGNCGMATSANPTPVQEATSEIPATQGTPVTGETSAAQGTPVTGETSTAQGTPVTGEGSASQDIPYNTAAYARPVNDRNRKTGIIAFIVIIVLAFLLLYMLVFRNFFGGSYKTPVKNLISAIEDQDIKKLYKALPDYQVKELKDEIDDYYDGDIEEFWSSSMLEDISIDYKIEDKEKLSKDELSDMEDEIKDYYDEKVNVSAGYELDVEFTMEIFGMEETDSTNITVVKMDGKWVIYDTGSIF